MKHSKNCKCDFCFRLAVISGVEKWIAKEVKKNPGKVCPFCGTNPSKPAKYGTGWNASCGHEVRKKGLVIGWKKDSRSKLMKCTCPEKTKQVFRKNFRNFGIKN